jgi:hypothetical protein
MSIVSMAEAKVQRDNPRPAVGTVKADPPEDPQPVGVPQSVLNQLMRYIPTESITLYIAILALFNPLKAPTGKTIADLSFQGRWINYAVFCALTLVLVPLLTLSKTRGAGKPFKWPLFEMAVAPIAFTAWAFALPDTPLRTISGYKEAIGATLVLTATVLIGVVADSIGKAPGAETVAIGTR